jgi:hypothetical protein
MGKLAEISMTDYHSSFADQGKQTSVFLSVGSKQREVAIFR